MTTKTKAPAHAADCAALVSRTARVRFENLLLHEALRELLTAVEVGGRVAPSVRRKARKALGLSPAVVQRN